MSKLAQLVEMCITARQRVPYAGVLLELTSSNLGGARLKNQFPLPAYFLSGPDTSPNLKPEVYY